MSATRRSRGRFTFSGADIERWVGRSVALKGRDIVRDQAVLSVTPVVTADTINLTARIQGTARAPYVQHIHLGGPRLVSRCTCPVTQDCKHVAAALYALLDEYPEYDSMAHAAGASEVAVSANDAKADARTNRTAGSPIHALISQWLDSVEASAKPALRAAERSRELVYWLTWHFSRVQVRIAIRQMRKNGAGQLRPVTGDLWKVIGDQPNYLQDSDRDVLESLSLMRASRPGVIALPDSWDLAGERGALTLQQLLATGRLYGDDAATVPVIHGSTRAVQLAWQTSADGTQRLVPEFSPQAALVQVDPPWYWDAAQSSLGEVALGIPVSTFYQALQAPRVPAASADALPQEFADRLSALDLPVPKPVPSRTIRGEVPRPVLTLTSEQLELSEFSRYGRSFKQWVDYGRLSFEYGEVRLDDGFEPVTRKLSDGVLLLIERDLRREEAARKTLAERGLLAPVAARAPFAHDASMARVWLMTDRDDWFSFLTQDVPQLRELGFRIDVDASFRYRLAEVEAVVGDISPEPTSSDWFEVDLGIMVDGVRHALMPLLLNLFEHNPKILSADGLAALRTGVPIILQLGDRYVSLPSKRVEGILATLVEMVDQIKSGAPLRLNRMDAAKLADAEEAAGVTWHAPTALIKLARDLRQRAGMEVVPVPSGLRATLRPYQQDGLNWLQFLSRAEIAGILADDMGLGKTLQTLAHILVEKQHGRLTTPALIVAPTSLVHNWQREAAKFAPELRVLALHGMTRKGKFSEIADHDLVITTYPLLVRDREVLAAQPFHLAVLDEAQFIKNASTQAAKVARDLNVRHRLCLTGTPLENHLGELWSQFNFLAPGLLGDSKTFSKTYRTPIEKHGDVDRLSQLNRRLSALILRRTKEQVASELPAKTEIIRSVELLPQQRDLYESIRISLVARVREEIARRGISQSQIIILDALLKLRQVCCDPRLVKLESARSVGESAKMDLLMTLLPELLDEGRRILVFSQFTSMLDLIETELRSRGIHYVILTGETKDRATPVERFQNGEVPVFLISLKAGGTGLNLTAADCVIHYDPWWNPAAENQATDRAHRIGQNKPVFVYKLVALGTVEEKITAMQARKAALAASILGDSELRGAALGESDIEALFEPLEPALSVAPKP